MQGALLSRPVASRHGIFFWFLGTLVKVRYSFLLGALILGANRHSVPMLLVWVTVVFVGILIHEVGHAILARHYRQDPQIELHATGGVTSWSTRARLTWTQRVLISMAGPGAGLLLGGLVYFTPSIGPEPFSYAWWVARRDLLWVTFGWGVFNLIPLLPFDGGQVLREILERLLGVDRGRSVAHIVSAVTGALGVVAGIAMGQPFVALVCAFYAFNNVQWLRGQPGVELPR